MSGDSSKHQPSDGAPGWSIPRGLFAAILSFVTGQLASLFLIRLYARTIHPLSSDSISVQFVYVALAELITLGLLWLLLRRRAHFWQAVGLRRLRLSDGLYVVLGAVLYYVLYFVVVGLVTQVITVDVNQQQNIGFQNATGLLALILTGISLVVLPPLVEEIIFRGVIYGGFRRRIGPVAAALFTSVLFAVPHSLESSDGKLLWIAAIDTFVLSLVLCYLREKTGGLWASIGVHAVKNGIAFASLFILHLH